MKERDTTTISFRLPKADAAHFKKVVEANDLNGQDVLRSLVHEFDEDAAGYYASAMSELDVLQSRLVQDMSAVEQTQKEIKKCLERAKKGTARPGKKGPKKASRPTAGAKGGGAA